MREPAFPQVHSEWADGRYTGNVFSDGGLTKRELFAALVMQGLLANPDRSDASDDRVARWAVNAADSLLNALNAEPQS